MPGGCFWPLLELKRGGGGESPAADVKMFKGVCAAATDNCREQTAKFAATSHGWLTSAEGHCVSTTSPRCRFDIAGKPLSSNPLAIAVRRAAANAMGRQGLAVAVSLLEGSAPPSQLAPPDCA